jgi:hypothetical protein
MVLVVGFWVGWLLYPFLTSWVGFLLNPFLARFTQIKMMVTINRNPMIPKTIPRMRPKLEEKMQLTFPHQS